jgi:hypothetical protein
MQKPRDAAVGPATLTMTNWRKVAYLSEKHKEKLEGVEEVVYRAVVQHITQHLVSFYRLRECQILRLAGVAGHVKPCQVADPRAVSHGPKSATEARKRGEPAVQLPTLGLLLLAPFSPSSEGNAVGESACNKRPDLKSCSEFVSREPEAIAIQCVDSAKLPKRHCLQKDR